MNWTVILTIAAINTLPGLWNTHASSVQRPFYCFLISGITTVREITYQTIIDLMETDRTCSVRTKMLILRYTAAMLRFCSEKGLCRAEFSLLLDRKIYPHVGILHSFSEENQAIIEKNRYKSRDFPADEYQETVEPFIETLQKHGYIGTTLYLARHSLTALYLFLDIHGLVYHPRIMLA